MSNSGRQSPLRSQASAKSRLPGSRLPKSRLPKSRLLRVKLRAPAKPEHYIRRARLHDLLDEVGRAPVTLVLAPAGAGKTSLLSAWIAEQTTPAGWLTLDEMDRDPARLWTGIIEALETIAAGCGDQARPLLRHPEDLGAAIDELTDGIERLLTAPAILVLDDVHLIDDNDPVAGSLARFLTEIPSLLHVVVASRLAPRLPLDRLRVRGNLGEVHFAELRFSPREVEQLLARLTPWMPGDEVASTAARVEGWAAGVQLFALAARAARASAESGRPALGADLMVHDYVWREVLAHEDPALVQILLDIAVVDRVDSGLAQALTGRADAGDLLLRAEVRGLFVSRLGPDGWFQVHALVRGALMSELARTSPGTIGRQHARAARWFEAADEVALAVEHWLLADQPRSALRLLAANQHRLCDTGWESTIKRTIGAISTEGLTADLDAMLDFAWCHLLVSRRRFVELVEQVGWLAGRGGVGPVFEARLTVLRSMAAIASGRWRAGGGLARQALDDFGEAWWRDPLGRHAWNLVAREAALTESWDDSSDAIREAESALSYEPSRRVDLEGTRALGEALAGWPLDALRVAAGLRGDVAAVESLTSLDAELSTAEAVAHWEIGDRARALVELEALASAPAESMLYCRVRALLELTLAYLGEGNLAAARRWFDLAETLVEDESLEAGARDWLARAGTRVALAGGDLDSARRWAAQVDDRFWGPVSAARVQLAEGDRSDARRSLATATARCPRHDVVLALLQARAADDREERLKVTASAIERAATCGMLQTVVSEGPEILELVEQAAWRAPTAWMERLRRAAVPSAVLDPGATHEPLTERERDVLRFLPSRLTLGEIAGELYISLNTLKFHLKVIYRKLGVNSRAEAAEVARRTGPSTASNG